MKVQRVGSRGLLLSFDDPYPTNTYAIIGSEHVFLCDTFCGPTPMAEIHNALIDASADRPIVVFNTHSDYDHHWGNCYFSPCMIISHIECRKNIINNGNAELRQYKEHMRGRVLLTPPNLVFTDHLIFPEEEVEFFWSPGHTTDSASCVDHVDQVLIAGDNIEGPIPYLRGPNFEQYNATLKKYVGLRPRYIVTGHDRIQTDMSLLTSNQRYIMSLSRWEMDLSRLPERALMTHLENLAQVVTALESKSVPDEAREHCRAALVILEEMERTPESRRLIDRLRPFA